MTGIGGIIGSASADLLSSMQQTLAHRGKPQVWSEDKTALISFSTEAAVSETFVVVADARIDNATELNEHFARHYLPPQNADVELIASAYQIWGMDCPRYLTGDFAFAVCNRRSQACFLARDPLGIKPIYYAHGDSWLIFATEAQALLHHPQVSDAFDEVMLGWYLLFQFGDEERTFFRDIRALPPANSLTFPEMKKTRYWDIDPAKRILYPAEEDYAAHFLEIFTQSVTDRLRGADRAAIMLSGGLDSGSVASVVHDKTDLHAYSFTFDRLTVCDEREYIETMRDKVHLHEVPLEDYWLFGDKAAYKPRRDTPALGFDSSMYAILADMREHGINILFTGHGGDNVMVGSPLVYADQLRRLQPSLLRDVQRHGLKTILKYGLKPVIPEWALNVKRRFQRIQRYPEWIDSGFLRRLPSHQPDTPPLSSHARRAMYRLMMDLPTVRSSVHWHDWIGQGYGVDTRHPFLDRRLVEFVIAIPPQVVYGDGERKPLLRLAMRGILPEKVRSRRDKTSFDRFFEYSLLEKEWVYVRDLMTHSFLAKMGIVVEDKLEVNYNIGRLNTGVNNQVNYFWSFLTLERWLQEYYT
ncbi:MAG: asparagine synthase-related protein [Chloroflexi bacterium]|nr:asparagine synthase-related protein [Chloroflexota bacterium]